MNSDIVSHPFVARLIVLMVKVNLNTHEIPYYYNFSLLSKLATTIIFKHLLQVDNTDFNAITQTVKRSSRMGAISASY